MYGTNSLPDTRLRVIKISHVPLRSKECDVMEQEDFARGVVMTLRHKLRRCCELRLSMDSLGPGSRHDRSHTATSLTH